MKNMIKETTSEKYERLERERAGDGYLAAASEILAAKRKLKRISPANDLLGIFSAGCDGEISPIGDYQVNLYPMLDPDLIPRDKSLSLLEEAGLYVDFVNASVWKISKTR